MDSTRIFVIYVFLMVLLLVLTDKKSDGASYRVEGCFSDFTHMYSKDMKTHNSNLRCQDMCRERGFIFSATNGSYCQCGNNYPTGKKVGDNQCSSSCRSWSPCHQLQSCCGGPKSYTMSVVGNIMLPSKFCADSVMNGRCSLAFATTWNRSWRTMESNQIKGPIVGVEDT